MKTLKAQRNVDMFVNSRIWKKRAEWHFIKLIIYELPHCTGDAENRNEALNT